MDRIEAQRDAERTLYILGRPVPILKAVRRPPVTWDAVVPGLIFPVLEYVVTPDALDWYYRVLAGPFLGSTADPRDVVPPLFFADEPMQCVNTLFDRSGRLHTGHFVEAFRSIPVNATVRSSARVSARYVASAKSFYEVNCLISVANAVGDEPVLRVQATFII